MAELIHETCARARLDTSLQSPMKYTQEWAIHTAYSDACLDDGDGRLERKWSGRSRVGLAK